jgi:signal transduction histidine kinase
MENARLYGEVHQTGAALRQANEELERRVEERTRELRQAQASLVETARLVGMSEVAANVLHDVGNALTSLMVDTQQMRQMVKGLRVDRVVKVFQLLEEHRGNLKDFATRDPRGRDLFVYMPNLAARLTQEQESLRQGLEAMAHNVERVRTIIHLQQRYPKATLLVEECDLAEVLEEALRLQAGALERANVQVTKELASLPPVKMDKHRVMQILLNLLSNARQAMEPVSPGRRTLGLRLTEDARGVCIQVKDSGIGIAPEVRGSLFQQGFTTRKEGNGIGLHSSALAAQLMGGQLTLESGGPGKGATATLVLPRAEAGSAAPSAAG